MVLFRSRFKVLTLLVLASNLAFSGPSHAKSESDTRYSLVVGPYTHHWTRSDEHSYVWLLGVEQIDSDRRVSGISFFKNSFNQPSLFVYPWGRQYDNLMGRNSLFTKWGAGVLYGYVNEYKDKVPLNHNGFSPGLILALGWRFTPNSNMQINFLGTAGIMFSVNQPL
jgi:hypothetical protein